MLTLPYVHEIVLLIGDEPVSVSFFKLKHSYVLICDLTDKKFFNSESIKVIIKFKNKCQTYCCQFECGDKQLKINASNSLTFSGFSWNAEDGRVNKFNVDDRTCCCPRTNVATGNDLILSIFIHDTIDKYRRPVCDGLSSYDVVDSSRRPLFGFESKERSHEIYERNTRYAEGELLMSMYIIFYRK